MNSPAGDASEPTLLGSFQADGPALPSTGRERGWTVCRFHGAGGGGPKGMRNGNYKHGLFTTESVQIRRSMATLIQASRKALATLSGDHGAGPAGQGIAVCSLEQ